MLGFGKDYPGAKQVLLDVNFRSTPEIVKTSDRLIRKNSRRFKKEIRARKPSGKPVDTLVFRDTSESGSFRKETPGSWSTATSLSCTAPACSRVSSPQS